MSDVERTEAARRGLRTGTESGPGEQIGTARPFFRRILGSLARTQGATTPAAARSARHAISLSHALLSQRGEVSGARLATELQTAYQALDAGSRDVFFDYLVNEFSPDPSRISKAAEAYRKEPTQQNLLRLQTAVEPPSQELFRRFNMAAGGTRTLVELRQHLLPTLASHPERATIDADLAHLFRSWFNRGFLVLQRIDWRTSALILERLIEYEAVHQIQGWHDLRRRLEADRRCYAFFHPALPEEPLIYIEVALTHGMSAKVQPLLDPDSPVVDPLVANCAIFYSITNCQEGLRGVSFGNFLIKQVAEDLGREFPRLKRFATLSPIPGFRKWLVTSASARGGDGVSAELVALAAALEGPEAPTIKTVPAPLREELSRSCACYLLNAKQGKAPADAVARFHLANGARMERLNWMGDISETGLRRSFGLMVNYVYNLADVERNHEAFAKDYRIVASHDLERLARQCSLGRADAP